MAFISQFMRCITLTDLWILKNAGIPGINPISRTVAHQARVSMDFPAENTRVICHSLLQEIFPTQGSNLDLLHLWQIL